jgi:hypothetical protein
MGEETSLSSCTIVKQAYDTQTRRTPQVISMVHRSLGGGISAFNAISQRVFSPISPPNRIFSPPMDKADDNTPQFYSSRQNALRRSPTPSNNSQSSLVSPSGNTVPKSLQKMPSYAEYTRMALSSSDSHGVTRAYPDAASNQSSSRGTKPRPTDYPTTVDPVAASTGRERTSKNRKDMSPSRSGQVSPHIRVVLACDPHQEPILRYSPLLV